MSIKSIKNLVSIFVLKIICGIKHSKKYSNISAQRKISKSNSSIKLSIKINYSAKDISIQEQTKLSSTPSEWKKMILKIPESISISHNKNWEKKVLTKHIIICFFASNIKIKVNCPHICYSFKDFANCSILSTAYSLMSESNLNLMPSTKCGPICKKIQDVEEFAAIWVLNFRIHLMSQVIEMMDTMKNNYHA